jgi:glycosyltransferase involved in cell wall biosynthesis
VSAGLPVLTVAVPCRTDEPELGRTLAAAWADVAASAAGPVETLVCLNGADAAGSRALADARAVAASAGVPVDVLDVDAGAALPPATDAHRLVVLCTRRAGKAIAWNVLRRLARGEVVVFLDADVGLGDGAIGLLLALLDANPGATIASPKTTCAARPTAFERIMAAPYGVDFPNLSGQLYAARTAALPAAMPEDLIEPERWLELVVGRERVVREARARVVVRLPATLADFYRQRIRIEMGKVQLDAEYPGLAARGQAQPRARAAWARLRWPDLVRLAVYLALRESAHVVAARRWRRREAAGVWVQAASTKRWSA